MPRGYCYALHVHTFMGWFGSPDWMVITRTGEGLKVLRKQGLFHYLLANNLPHWS